MTEWKVNVVISNDGVTKLWREHGTIMGSADDCEARLMLLLENYSDVEAVAPGGFTLESQGGRILRSDTVNAR